MTGTSIVAGACAAPHGAPYHAWDPAANAALPDPFFTATLDDLDAAAAAARDAFTSYARTDGATRAALLRAIAAHLEARRDALVQRAMHETALPRARLHSELGRTTGQLDLFAALVESDQWTDPRIDRGDPVRAPLPKPDVRSMLRPLGVVAVFGASNFPFAFSVPGGDTASALAAGCPVIAKAHPAHPGVSELAGEAIRDAVAACGLPAGVFALLHDAGHAIGAALVQHEAIAAVAFTGSLRGGRALMDLAAARRAPIPVFAEMGSVNPVFVTPAAARERGEALAQGLAGSVTLGAGQFCTNPGIVVVTRESAAFVDALEAALSGAPEAAMLTPGIAAAYADGVRHHATLTGAPPPGAAAACHARPAMFRVDASHFLATPALREEVFGPTTLIVVCDTTAGMRDVARAFDGQLTATIHASAEDDIADLALLLEARAGRVVFNGFPTGVEVCHAMVHGGPYPATSDARATSVGSRALTRFARAIAWQDAPDALLPPALRDANPLGLARLVDGFVTRDAVTRR